MQEFTIQRSSRRCHATDRPFVAGERYYSAVLQRGSELIRQDFSSEHWPGPPDKTIGWWVSQMPAKPIGKRTLAPTHVLLSTLERLCENPEDSDLAYLLAVLLVRRRILNEPTSEAIHDESTTMHLVQPAEGREWIIPVCHPSVERTEHLHQKLIELLYCEQ